MDQTKQNKKVVAMREFKRLASMLRSGDSLMIRASNNEHNVVTLLMFTWRWNDEEHLWELDEKCWNIADKMVRKSIKRTYMCKVQDTCRYKLNIEYKLVDKLDKKGKM